MPKYICPYVGYNSNMPELRTEVQINPLTLPNKPKFRKVKINYYKRQLVLWDKWMGQNRCMGDEKQASFCAAQCTRYFQLIKTLDAVGKL